MLKTHFNNTPGALLLTLHGSRLFGVHNPTSDLDVKLITQPALKDLLMGKRDALTPRETKLDDLETTNHPIQSFLNMLKRSDTNAIDMLFATRSPHTLLASTPAGERLLELLNPEKLVTRNLSGALGYARAQAHKYSQKGDRLNALNALIDMLQQHAMGARTGEALGVHNEADLPALLKHLPANSSNDVSYEEQENREGSKQRFLRVTGKNLDLNAKVSFNLNILVNTANGYGARAQAAADAAGTDLKAWYHALRVTNQAMELHATGNLTFPRPNANFLRQVRDNKFSTDQLQELLNNNLQQVEEAEKASVLRENFDNEYAENIVLELYQAKP